MKKILRISLFSTIKNLKMSHRELCARIRSGCHLPSEIVALELEYQYIFICEATNLLTLNLAKFSPGIYDCTDPAEIYEIKTAKDLFDRKLIDFSRLK